MTRISICCAVRAVGRTASWSLIALLIVFGAPAIVAAEPAGIPLNASVPIRLGEDLGFGKTYRPSLEDNFQNWGALAVSSTDGFPTRLGERSIRFETREGFCGRDGAFWSDCANGRNRHELSTSSDPDPWNKDNWYALSIYIPAAYDPPRNIGTSLLQFWAGGLDSWMFRYWKGRGFLLERKLDNARSVIVPGGEVLDRWIDVVLRVRHSIDERGSFTVWADGERMYHYAGRTAAGDDRSRSPYFKFGIYSTALGADGQPIGEGGFGNGEGLPNLHLFFDEVRYGLTCADLGLAELGYDCATFTYEDADSERVAELQQALNALGCNVGAADGVIGPRTLSAALSCRYFEDGRLPDELTAANLQTFIALYSGDGAADLPRSPPDDRVTISSVSSDLVGGNDDHALTIRASAQGLDLNFIIIGRFDDAGATRWLDILLEDDLGEIPAALRQCRRVRTESWGDGSTHAVIQFSPGSGSYAADGGDCIVAALPPDVAGEADYLLENFTRIAAAIISSRAEGVTHDEIRAFLKRAASGDVILSR